jgi:radical SAM protein with 4Fe4S-binding SPASM domain
MNLELDGQLTKAKAEAERFALPLEIKTEDKYSRDERCRWPWKSAYIASNGDVVPCCIFADADVVNMGNVFEKDFATLWSSEKYQGLRRRIREYDLPTYCKGCYVDAQTKARYSRAEASIEKICPRSLSLVLSGGEASVSRIALASAVGFCMGASLP